MKYNYQKIDIRLNNKQVNIKITLVNDVKALGEKDLPSYLEDKIKNSFEKKENSVFTHYADELQILVCITKNDHESLRKLGAKTYAVLKENKVEEVLLGSKLTQEENFYFVEGLLLSSYDFNKYKKDKKENLSVVYLSEEVLSKESIDELKILTESVSLTKTLVNEPLNFMNALKFADVASEIGKHFGFETEVLHKKQIETLKMGGLLAVNKGSVTPPTFNIFSYKPEHAVNTKPIVLVGKGVMYDTGGYSLKIGGHMQGMKSDMGGGAAVLGSMSAIAGNNLPFHVIGLVPATDNMISGDATVVDDIITTMDGTTVEVLNTDAEGRLVLSDALIYAKKYDPSLVIDMATLTGASVAITGDFGIAMAGNCQEQMDVLKEKGNATYERLIQLPFWDEYAELLKSNVADLKNIGGSIGGATTAGKFLEHFTDYPWIHLDIAGISFLDNAKDYRQAGGTGAPVRLMYEFIKSKASQ